MNTALLTTIIGGVVGVLGVVGTIVVQRMSGRITSVNATIDQFQEAAARADGRAEAAEKGVADARREVGEMWSTIRGLQAEVTALQQQLDWSKGHIRRLTDHINDGKGPPPPAMPEGLHWPRRRTDETS